MKAQFSLPSHGLEVRYSVSAGDSDVAPKRQLHGQHSPTLLVKQQQCPEQALSTLTSWLVGQDDPGPQQRARNLNSRSPGPHRHLLPTWHRGSTDFHKELLHEMQ